jgi:hypothetical protein
MKKVDFLPGISAFLIEAVFKLNVDFCTMLIGVEGSRLLREQRDR